MVTGRPTSLKNRITGGQGHWRTSFCWRTGSLEDKTLMEDRVTGRPDLAGGQDQWIAGLVCRQDFAGVHDFAERLDFAGAQDCKICLQGN